MLRNCPLCDTPDDSGAARRCRHCGADTTPLAPLADVLVTGSGHASGTMLPGHLMLGGRQPLGGFIGSGW